MLTIESAEPDSCGIRLVPGIRLSEAAGRPAIGRMMQGARVELRQTDGRITQTSLVTYGISVKENDGSLYLEDDPSDPEIKLTVAGDLTPAEVAPGTEVWLCDDDSS
jgi:hypothetical protein